VPGLEPGACRLGGGCSVHLSYTRSAPRRPVYQSLRLTAPPTARIVSAMARQPFVWEIHIRRELLDDELSRLRDLPYSLWRDIVGKPQTKKLVGRDGHTYTLTLEANWSGSGSEDIEVAVTLRGPGWRRATLSERFVITPQNQFR
jgi:hypothetical protein